MYIYMHRYIHLCIINIYIMYNVYSCKRLSVNLLSLSLEDASLTGTPSNHSYACIRAPCFILSTLFRNISCIPKT